ncbi:unnamed protein product [Merluccius merluccius]
MNTACCGGGGERILPCSVIPVCGDATSGSPNCVRREHPGPGLRGESSKYRFVGTAEPDWTGERRPGFITGNKLSRTVRIMHGQISGFISTIRRRSAGRRGRTGRCAWCAVTMVLYHVTMVLYHVTNVFFLSSSPNGVSGRRWTDPALTPAAGVTAAAAAAAAAATS